MYEYAEKVWELWYRPQIFQGRVELLWFQPRHSRLGVEARVFWKLIPFKIDMFKQKLLVDQKLLVENRRESRDIYN